MSDTFFFSCNIPKIGVEERRRRKKVMSVKDGKSDRASIDFVSFSFPKSDRSWVLDSIGVELILGDVNTDKDGEVLRHTKTSFRLIWLKGEGRSLQNQTSRVTRVKNPTNSSWLKAGDRLL